MKRNLIILTVIYTVNALPQNINDEQPDPDDGIIESIFTTQRSANYIETPDPTYVPLSTKSPSVREQQCTCVPYHMCDPGDGPLLINIRGNEYCEDPLDVCCSSLRKPSTSTEPPTGAPMERGVRCGVRNPKGLGFKIAGAFNNEAEFGEFPWTVAIIHMHNDSSTCGGSLIHPKAILTGYHCVRNYVTNAKDLKVRAGEWDTQTTKEHLPHQERIVSRIIGHPNFMERDLANDIAIVVLEKPFQMDRHISTICLPPAGFVPYQQNCLASGWGKDIFGVGGRYSAIMKKVPLPIVEFNECQRKLQATRLGEGFRLDNSLICAGGVKGVDTCEGDGGAPLVCPVGRPEDNRYAQNGIVAWGIECNQAIPGVYANVALARTWIDETVRSIGLDTSYYTFSD